MHMTIKNRWTTTALALALPLWVLTSASALAAPPRAGSTTVTRTGPAGNTATRQQSGSYNAATHTYTRSGSTTGPNGKQSSFNTSLQATGNGYNRTATRTAPNGATATKTTSVTTTPASN
jgi:hypothetical protein